MGSGGGATWELPGGREEGHTGLEVGRGEMFPASSVDSMRTLFSRESSQSVGLSWTSTDREVVCREEKKFE